MSFSAATLTVYHSCFCLSTTFFNFFYFLFLRTSKVELFGKNQSSVRYLPHRSLNISRSFSIVKRICCIFLNNFFDIFQTTKYAIFSLFYLYFVVFDPKLSKAFSLHFSAKRRELFLSFLQFTRHFLSIQGPDMPTYCGHRSMTAKCMRLPEPRRNCPALFRKIS